jgi:hypothetical protein
VEVAMSVIIAVCAIAATVVVCAVALWIDARPS